jgi:hypothetical protein
MGKNRLGDTRLQLKTRQKNLNNFDQMKDKKTALIQ